MGIIKVLGKTLSFSNSKKHNEWEFLGKRQDYDLKNHLGYSNYPKHFPKWVQKAFERTEQQYGEVCYFKGKNYRYKIVASSTSNDPPSRILWIFYRKKRGK